ncbi:MAG: TIGR04282 family arsenosugar biosynthesis glycosyltransferase [Desulfuromonadales bacterium]|nr:TIGR04282 family arsenosugar biosynthesis glycosyltransferase [Desulfuromonadales bacterium]
MNRGLIVFAREPVPGHVKTRLAGEVGIKAATGLYAAMLEDVLECASRHNDTRVLVFWAMESEVLPSHPGYPRLEMFRQCGASLGERIAAALEAAFASGIRTCCVIGSDSPDLPPDYITQAFQLLDHGRADVVLGPAVDGGYYLVGTKRLWRRLFEDIAWGGSDVLKTSCERARELGLRTALLPEWYDLDTLADLRRLAETPGLQAPRTRQLLRHLQEILNSPKKENSV